MINEPMYVAHLHAAGWVVDGLGKFYRATGYEPARELGEKLTRYLMIRLPDGTNKHWHTHSQSLLGILELALATGDKRACEFAAEHFERLKARGNVEMGFFPEVFGDLWDYRTAETCAVAGMIAVAFKLTESGVADCWDEVDRWVRNQFAESQLTQTDWIDRLAMRDFIEGHPGADPSIIDPRMMSDERVSERVLGSFASGPAPNDWLGTFCGINGCCVGNGNRAWYFVWENILHHDDGKLRVNLLLKWADIDSHVPYVGQVDIKIKQPVDLSIRIPQWVGTGQTRVQVNDRDRSATWDGRYAKVGPVKPNDLVTMTFPIRERPSTQWIQGHRYNLMVRGSEIVYIDPPGKAWSFYQRNHYRKDATRWRKIERFVAEKEIYH